MGPSAQLLETARAVHKDTTNHQRINAGAQSFAGAERSLSTYQNTDDPRTIMQIKRSRVDLEKRYVFLCPTSLNKHFDSVPPEAKQKCLLVFKCSRDWVIPSSADQAKIVCPRVDCWSDRQTGDRFRNKQTGEREAKPWQSVHELSRDFISWVIHKERDGAVFWFKPERDLRRLSEFLGQHMDPVTGETYQPLLLDPSWWRVKFMRTCAKYVHNPSKVVACIQHLMEEENDKLGDLDIPALQELLYQSNPTIEPIAKWPHAPSIRYTPKTVPPLQTDFVGKETTYKGYVDHDQASARSGLDSGLPVGIKVMREGNRIQNWPADSKVRLDNLHIRWQLEDSVSHRHESLAPRASSAALTARAVIGGHPRPMPSQYAQEAAAAVRALTDTNRITTFQVPLPIGKMIGA